MALAYTNRFGNRYYLHARPTKKGKTRLVMARAVGVGALDELPEGHEIRETVNGQVSVAKATPRLIRPEEEDIILAGLRAIPRLAHHTAAFEGASIVVHEPLGGAEMLAAFGAMGRIHQPRYAPVLRFGLSDRRVLRTLTLWSRGRAVTAAADDARPSRMDPMPRTSRRLCAPRTA